MGRRGAPDKKNLYVVFSYSFFKAGAQSRCVLIAVNNSVSNKPKPYNPLQHNTCCSSVGNSREWVSLLVKECVCVCVSLVFCGPIDSSCKFRSLMMSQFPTESGSTCQRGRRREKRIWTCWFLQGKGVSVVHLFKYLDIEGLFSASLPHCCASIHEADFFQWSYVSFDMYNFFWGGALSVPYRWRRMMSWGELMINAVNACVWFRPTTGQSETSWKRWRNQMACEYTLYC